MAEKFGSTGSVNDNLKIYDKRILVFFFETTDEYEIIANVNKLSTTKLPGIEDIPTQLMKKDKYILCT